jgi:hypothetical protein
MAKWQWSSYTFCVAHSPQMRKSHLCPSCSVSPTASYGKINFSSVKNCFLIDDSDFPPFSSYQWILHSFLYITGNFLNAIPGSEEDKKRWGRRHTTSIAPFSLVWPNSGKIRQQLRIEFDLLSLLLRLLIF